ncbi:uncharacterized protein K489DRAFT_380831 [Dissoconium aciculare CBS 342.82]|uniref:Uncharacterized protein n=1 Tax=Dissoconium aciculare CBS 342.82 TaxID=1314786 RepID=A0A6J3M263_9PEZI|nr:uncharacterized protein K489DRAFT_380831 [Dissoconium aciculare CBS 342.82]KAF1822096.1 hypothetical protein K489DRAFT_380831 [Dissoconium aciculare CBS 342.82]
MSPQQTHVIPREAPSLPPYVSPDQPSRTPEPREGEDTSATVAIRTNDISGPYTKAYKVQCSTPRHL